MRLHWPQHCVGKFVWRFATGAHMDGRVRCNSTWFIEGTLPKHRANWWNRKPRFWRATWRWGIVLALVLEFLIWRYSVWAFTAINVGLFPFVAFQITRLGKQHVTFLRRVAVPSESRAPLPVEREQIDSMGASEDVDEVPDAPPIAGKVIKADKRFNVKGA